MRAPLPTPPLAGRRLRHLGTALAALAVLAAQGASTTHAPAAPQAAPPDSVRLLANLAFLASDSLAGRATGTVGNATARAFLLDALLEAGVDTFPAGPEAAFEFTRRNGEAFRGVNVLGWIRGTDTPHRYVVVTAHYDHVGVRRGEIYNGADDNASGAVALVEVAHALVSAPPRNSVIIVALDAEEMGLQGARAFLADPPVPLDSMALNVNLDMVARGDGVLWAGGAYHTPALEPILRELAGSVPVTLRLGHDRPNDAAGADWTLQSDHAAFHGAGIPFVYFGVDDHPDYHRPTDDFEKVDPGHFVANVRTILAGLRALDAALPLPTP